MLKKGPCHTIVCFYAETNAHKVFLKLLFKHSGGGYCLPSLTNNLSSH
jgi:hypothetical protein